MKKLIVILSIFFVSEGYSQITNYNLNGVPARLSAYSNIDGSPYLYDDWTNANLYLKNGDVKEKITLKVNTYENEIEMLNDSGTRIYLDKSAISAFKIDRPTYAVNSESGDLRTLTFKNGFSNVKGIDEKVFVNLLAEGEHYTIIRKYKTDLIEPPKNSYSPTPGKMFVLEQAIYVVNKSGEVSSARKKNNSIVSSLNNEDKSLGKKIIKDNNLDLSREDHILVFFNKLNETKN